MTKPKKSSSGKAPKASNAPGNPPAGASPQNLAIMQDVTLLLRDLTNPETPVTFSPPLRANAETIRRNIAAPGLTWRWADATARNQQSVAQADAGKYGIQLDTGLLYRLSSALPVVWQSLEQSTILKWTWTGTADRMAQIVSGEDVGRYGLQLDSNTIYQLTGVDPPAWQAQSDATSGVSPIELSKGASDVDSYHDFFRLQVAFEDVWKELLNGAIQGAGQKLYAWWDYVNKGDHDNAGLPFDTSLPGKISSVDELDRFVSFLKAELGISSNGTIGTGGEYEQLKVIVNRMLQGCDMLLNQINRVGHGVNWDNDDWLNDTLDHQRQKNDPSLTMDAFPDQLPRKQVFDQIGSDLSAISVPDDGSQDAPDIRQLLDDLDKMLRGAYRFDVFAPDSINYGLLLNYRQHWHPQSYQVGNLVSTIPLAPQETRRYTTKTVVKKRRNVKEIDNALRGVKDDSSTTWRVDAEIVDRAKNQTNFQKNASGSFGNDNLYKVSVGMQQGQNQDIESAQTRREFHEAVVKSAQEYRSEHRLEIDTEESREEESTSYQELRNPNDELTVTYLFYELQRRYLVDEQLHKVTPVIMVANEVPAPHTITPSWILQHDWIIRRAILDASFVPALDYLSSNYVGEELTLKELQLSVIQQRGVVDKIGQQVQFANSALNAATVGLESAESDLVQNERNAETGSFIKSFFDPLGLTKSGSDGNADRAKVDFAKDALNRAQSKADQLVAQLKTETTALQVAIDKYTKAANQHFSMLADIDRLCVHVKDNIIYYLQAIWSYEPADQRYLRVYNLDVPVFTHNTTVPVTKAAGPSLLDPVRKAINVGFPPAALNGTKKLYQVADIENLIGFKGNYMIFPLVDFNYMTWFMINPYIDFSPTTGVTAKDPDSTAGLKLEDVTAVLSSIKKGDPKSFEQNRQEFTDILTRLITGSGPEMVIVPSKSLYIEALPGTHPLLEDFKLIHRAVDVKKAQADVRHAELENLRLAARLESANLGDPDVDKVVVVGDGQKITVDAGQ